MDADETWGPLAGEKQSDVAPGEPTAAEAESARLLANQARERLRSDGLEDHIIDRLAERYIAEDLGEDLDAFVAWALERARAGR